MSCATHVVGKMSDHNCVKGRKKLRRRNRYQTIFPRPFGQQNCIEIDQNLTKKVMMQLPT